MLPLISVLVPLYNVEPYLPECLDSVVGQTYRNLEIILVDDGSTDQSGAICDAYAAKDDRIRVIHQKNAGVAAARTAGLRAVTGNYIAWVDSDDVCAPDMLEYLYEGLTEHQADMSQCGFSRDYETYLETKAARSGTKADVLSTKGEIFCALFNNDISHNLTFKLYSARLLVDETFPDIKFGEDSWVQYKTTDKMDRAVLLPDIKYYYRQRSGSLMHSYSPEDCVATHKVLGDTLWANANDLPPYIAGLFTYVFAHRLSVALADVEKSNLPSKAQMNELLDNVRSTKRSVLTNPMVGPLGRLEILAICTGRPWSWRFAKWCQKVFNDRAERRELARAGHLTRLSEK